MRASAVIMAAFLFTGAAARGADDILSVIPNNAAIVIVGTSYDSSFGALKTFLDATTPDAVPRGGEEAKVQILADLIDLKHDLATTSGTAGLDGKGQAALALFVSKAETVRTLVILKVDEAKWRAANASTLAKDTSERKETVGGGQNPTSFIFQDGFLLMSQDANVLKEYREMTDKPLTPARRASIMSPMAEHSFVVNISAPTAARQWPGPEGGIAKSYANALGEYIAAHATGTETMPDSPTLIAKALGDVATLCDECILTVDVKDDSVSAAGRIFLKPTAVYAGILEEQKGADSGLELAGASAIAGVNAKLGGELVWAYLRGAAGPYVSGVSKDPSHTTEALQMVTKAIEDFQGKVGLSNVCVEVVPNESGKYPVPVLVAAAKDGPGAIDFISSTLAKFYGDKIYVDYNKGEGFILSPPTKTVTAAGGRGTAVVTVPLRMSALVPAKAAKFGAVMGNSITWRVTALPRPTGAVVVAGAFASEKGFEAFLADLEGSAGSGAADMKALSETNPRILGGFINVAAIVAERLKVSAKTQGKDVAGLSGAASPKTAAISFWKDADAVRLAASVPAEQVKSAYDVMKQYSQGIGGAKPAAASATTPASTKEEEKVKPPKRVGIGRSRE